MTHLSLISPRWPAPERVRAFSTTRQGGVSEDGYLGLNLGARCGDTPARVDENRRRLRHNAALPSEPVWLTQVHGNKVITLDCPPDQAPEADGAVTGSPNLVCAVLTADCLPVLLCDLDGTRVGVAHAGWRGLVAGVIENAVAGLGCKQDRIIAWLGPCIGQSAFEVGPEVRRAMLDFDPGCDAAIRPGRGDRWHIDLHAVARRRLAMIGVERVGESDDCTYSDARRFYSYRRDGVCGRMATLIWLAD